MTGTPILQSEYSGNLRLAVEFAWGADLTADPATWTWTDVTSDVLQSDGRVVTWTVGQQDEGTATQPASLSLALDDRANKYNPFNPYAANWPNVVENTPVRVRMSSDGGSTWWVRFQGGAIGFEPTWDTTGNYAIVEMTGAGSLRSLGQGESPLQSIMNHSALDLATIGNVAAYWSCEDGSQATQMASGIVGGSPMTYPSGTVTMSSDTGFVASAPLPVLGSGANLGGALMSTVDTTGKVYFRTLLFTPAGLTNGIAMIGLAMTGGSAARWYLFYETASGGSINLKGFDAAGTVVADDGGWAFAIDAKRFYLSIELVQSGSDISALVAVTFVDTSGKVTGSFLGPSTFTGLTVGRCTNVFLGGNGNMSGCTVGHIGVANVQAWLFASSSLLSAYSGEGPRDRMVRLSGEQNVTFTGVGFYSARYPMGPQGVDTYLNLMRECEITDSGFLYDGFDSGLDYQGISQRYDQKPAFAIDVSAHEMVLPFQPTQDDQRTHNKVTVQNKDSSFGVYQETAGQLGTNTIGIQGDTTVTPTPNYMDSTQLVFRAHWETHAGTVEGYRYPVLNLNFANHPTLGTAWLNRTDGFSGPVVPGSRITIKNISSWVAQHVPGDIELCAIGWTESVNQRTWTVGINNIPNVIYDVFKVQASLDGDVSHANFGRLDTAGSTVATAASVNATTLNVVSGDDVGWTTGAVFPADFPFYVTADGIKTLVHSIGQAQNANIDFESGIGSWAAQNGTFAIASDGTHVHNGSLAMKVTPDGVTASGGAVASRVAVRVGTKYVVAAWVYIVAGYSDVQMAVDWYTATSGGSFISTSLPGSQSVPAATWTMVSATVTAPATAVGGALRFRMGSTPGASVVAWVDEAYIGYRFLLEDTFARASVSNGWGTSDTGQAWSTTNGTASDYSTNGSSGLQSSGTVGVIRTTTVDSASTDVDWYADVSLAVASAATASITQWVFGRYTDASNYYAAQLVLTTGGAVQLAIIKRVGGSLSTIASPITVRAVHSGGDVWRVRFAVQGSRVRAKSWRPSAEGETHWQLSVTDTSLTTGTLIGCGTRLETGNTNTTPVVSTWDNVTVLSPQAFTVSGMDRAQSVGGAVKLWKPGVVSL